MAWTPGRRKAERALEAPFEDVPEHLAQPLWTWIDASLTNQYSGERTLQIGIDLRLPMPGTYQGRMNYLKGLVSDDVTFMLDIAEALLERFGWDGGRAGALKLLLELANSAYAVNDHWSGLEERTTPEIKAQVQAVVDAATGSPGDHLANAWNEAYGRAHDPVKSYAESVKAVEAALAPNITPQNDKQTLGTMIADVRSALQNFEFVIPNGDNSDGVQTVLAMMRQLWEGQTRHGGARPTRDETLEEAQAAVHLAAALVQYGVSGAFKRK